MSSKDDIKHSLDIRLQEAISAQFNGMKSAAPAIPTPQGGSFNPDHLVFGRLGLVNRVRGGKIQWRHTVSEATGYKILDGSLVKMTPMEKRRRKIGARIGARKRAAEISQIIRNRNISLRKRQQRIDPV